MPTNSCVICGTSGTSSQGIRFNQLIQVWFCNNCRIGKKIETREQHALCLRKIELLISVDPPAESYAGNRLTELAKLVEIYEKKHFKI